MEEKIIKTLTTPQLVDNKPYDTVSVTLYRSSGKALICDIVEKDKDELGNDIYVTVAGNIFFNENEQPFTEPLSTKEQEQLGI